MGIDEPRPTIYYSFPTQTNSGKPDEVISMKKVEAMKKELIKRIALIDSEATIAAMLVFAANTLGEKPPIPKAPKPKTPITQPKGEVRVLEYTFNDKPMIAVQTPDKPDEALLNLCRASKMRFYKNVPSNPFNNTCPFWAGRASEELKAALLAVA
jgi:hypothetical protein